jgi:hypothetical protein
MTRTVAAQRFSKTLQPLAIANFGHIIGMLRWSSFEQHTHHSSFILITAAKTEYFKETDIWTIKYRPGYTTQLLGHVATK